MDQEQAANREEAAALAAKVFRKPFAPFDKRGLPFENDLTPEQLFMARQSKALEYIAFQLGLIREHIEKQG